MYIIYFFFQYLGEAMRQLMKEDLNNFTPAHDKLWKDFFGFITKCLVDGQKAYGQ